MRSLDIPLYPSGTSHRRRSRLPGKVASVAMLLVAAGFGYLAMTDSPAKEECNRSAHGAGQLTSVAGQKGSGAKWVDCQGEPRR